jgi:hypothetical protein
MPKVMLFYFTLGCNQRGLARRADTVTFFTVLYIGNVDKAVIFIQAER